MRLSDRTSGELRGEPRAGATTSAGMGWTVFAVAGCSLLLYLYAGSQYGYFVDELYYLACSRHLAWGYVDQPSLIALIVYCVRILLGESLSALRLLPAIAGAGEVLLAAMLANELGGKRFAQLLAAIAVLSAPAIPGSHNLLTMNAFEPLFWLGCAWIVVRIANGADQRLWIWFGILAGFGLENKYSMLILGGGLVLGLLLTPERRWMASRWLWMGAAIAALILLPNVLWNIQHHFPFLELQANIRRSGRNVALGVMAFFKEETLAMNPLSLPLWISGLWFYFGSRAGRKFRMLGWAWLFTAAVIVAISPRIYYLFPAYPLLFAAGGVIVERWTERPALRWLRVAYATVLAVTGAALLPFGMPVLSPEAYMKYSKRLGIDQPAIENHKRGPLPQIFADQFGWAEMAAEVGRIYNGLPADVRSKTAVFGQNYGQAGAIDLFGPRYGLPPAISGHQNYFLWGPGNFTGESVIVMDGNREKLDRQFASVAKVGRVYHPYSMPYQHFDVFYCRAPRQPLKNVWAGVKNWD